jgi:hypothetical protein
MFSLGDGGRGHRFAHATVVAATTHQDSDDGLPFGYIDDYEGLVVVYDRDGSFMLSRDYGRSRAGGLAHGLRPAQNTTASWA